MKKQTLKTQIYQALQKSPLKGAVQRLSLFGSYAKGNASKKSDIDLLIDFFPSAKVSLFDLVRMKIFMEDFLSKEVDLVTTQALSPYLKEDILNQAELIYEG